MFVDHQFVEAEIQAVDSTLQRWKEKWPAMSIMALLPKAEKSCVGLLQSVCNARAVALHGAIFPELLDASGFRKQGILLACMRSTPGSFLLEDIQQDGAPRMAAGIESLMRQAPPTDASRGTLFTLFDAMLPNIGTLLNETHARLESAPSYIGVNAGNEAFQPMPCLFDNHRLVQNGVLGLYYPCAVKSAVHHAYEQSKSQWRATSASNNRIVTIDDQPAFEAYQKIIWDEYAVRLTKENFYDYAVHFPFGLITAVDILVRIPVALAEDNSIVCVGEISPESLLRVLKAPDLDASSCAQDIRTSLQPNNLPATSTALLTFYCAGRRMHFGAQAVEEIGHIQATMNQARLYGALSLGEIDTLEPWGHPRFHNAAVLCIADRPL